jgi:hypothetical protein
LDLVSLILNAKLSATPFILENYLSVSTKVVAPYLMAYFSIDQVDSYFWKSNHTDGKSHHQLANIPNFNQF